MFFLLPKMTVFLEFCKKIYGKLWENCVGGSYEKVVKTDFQEKLVESRSVRHLYCIKRVPKPEKVILETLHCLNVWFTESFEKIFTVPKSRVPDLDNFFKRGKPFKALAFKMSCQESIRKMRLALRKFWMNPNVNVCNLSLRDFF